MGFNPQKLIGIIPELINRVRLLADGMISTLTGLEQEAEGVAKSSGVLLDHFSTLFQYLAVFSATYISCGIYFLSKIRSCMIYYILDIIGQILYLPVRIFVWILKTIRLINLQPYVDKIWEYMEKLDMIIYTKLKFHIIHYPRSVRENCYVCKRLKMSVVGKQTEIIAEDFGPDGIGRDLVAGGENLMRALNDFMGVFAPLF